MTGFTEKAVRYFQGGKERIVSMTDESGGC